MAGAKNIAETVRAGIQPVADELGLTIWDVEFLKEGARRILRVTIDHEDGITIDDCERMHRAIDPVLDELDPTFGAPYTLNVSSPGLDRPLKTARDFEKKIGKRVEIKLYAPMKGKKLFEATLVGFDEHCIEVEEKGEKIKLEKAKIAKICQAIDFDGLL
jgi:ribosome maturation factor RimP